MPVSKKMVEAAKYHLSVDVTNYGLSAEVEDVDEALQAAINAAWTKFDKDDPKTWPNDEAVGILVKCAEPPHGYEVCWFQDGTFYSTGIPVREPTEYLLIADLLPSEEG